ncbi:hypothetical protein GTP56_16145 [Duganella sp. FT134W]|uniref:Uncharacterized protein n=1 Tax=Duganella margarita TaxID=2692170 RepID=A0A7X4H1R6_9BURK|nr:hypothetical protein [Duganella margarita]MYM73725.1 hypothetical protein [Duganella margarita]
MNKRLLTAKNPCNGGLYNKMPNPQADFFPNEINNLQNVKSGQPAYYSGLENKFSVHKWEARHRCDAAPGIL